MKLSTILIVVVAVLLIGGGAAGAWWYSQSTPASPSLVENGQADNTDTTTAGESAGGENSDTGISVDVGVDVGVPASKTVTVTYSSSGFSPSRVTINRGDTVRFVAQGNVEMWVGSNEHPEHTGYDGTTRSAHCAPGATPTFDQCSKGSSYSFTFTKAGTWGFHNHAESDHTGTVVVQ